MELKKQDVAYLPINVIDVPFDQKEKTKEGIVAAVTSNGFVWLKPLKDVYALTERDFRELIGRAKSWGYREGIYAHSEDMPKPETLEQFIKSITQS